jgi:hypothetical protein
MEFALSNGQQVSADPVAVAGERLFALWVPPGAKILSFTAVDAAGNQVVTGGVATFGASSG